ncbi:MULTISPECIES: DUF4253 domain-containing protein [Streptomyces]|uniref:DUF4253 domain-containing protein n=1 Tax=Streptomyces TaxID=1883 RepID=UPI002930669C|nr:DUF4253 domain-containing protein [Streptomyces sp. NEAU-HV9]
MATLPNPLPTLATDPSGRSLGLQLPPGRVIDELLWCADGPASLSGWTALQRAPRKAGLLPLLIDVGGELGGPENWELLPEETSYPGDHDAEEVLAEAWDQWPGLAPAGTPEADPEARAAEAVAALLESAPRSADHRLALVPARRSADVPAAFGWTGPLNYEPDVARLCAVLRSWEDRFGARAIALSYARLTLSVAAPPSTPAEAEALAVEHFAFCPDETGEDLPGYAKRLVGARTWSFWWD